MAPSFQDDLKAYKSLKLGPFRPTSHDTLEIAREFLNYIERVDSVFTELEVSDPDRKVKIFSLVEYELSQKAKAGIPDGSVSTEGDNWKKFVKKCALYYQTEKLQNEARKKLANIRQKDGQLAVDVKIEILKLWAEAGYGETDRDEHVLQILLTALKDDNVRLQYQYSLLPGKTKLTLDQIIEIANVHQLHKPKAHFSAHKVGSSHNRKFNYSKRFQKNKKFTKKSGNTGNSSYTTDRCGNCGWFHRDKNQCKAISATCHKCKKKGHFKSVCRSSGNSGKSGNTFNKYRNSSNNSNFSNKRKFRKSYNNRRVEEGEEDQAISNTQNNQSNCNEYFQSSDQRQLAELLAKSVHL